MKKKKKEIPPSHKGKFGCDEEDWRALIIIPPTPTPPDTEFVEDGGAKDTPIPKY